MSASVNAYRRGLCEVAHELLWWGYEKAKHKIHNDCHEEEITNYIFDEMLVALDDPQLDPLYNRFEPHNEWHVVGNKRSGKSRQRIDIVVRMTDSRPREKFCFEAKRLKKNEFSIGSYTGNEGMGCYLNEEYAIEDSEAAMVAYIQSDDSMYWHKELKRKFTEGNKNKLNCTKKPSLALETASIHKDIINEWKSEHNRPTFGNINLYHIFLDCI